jgi:hypothetical protein
MDLIEKHGRMRWNDPIWVERLEKEIDLLHNNGVVDLLPYFFIDEEVCDLYGATASSPARAWFGRRSAAGVPARHHARRSDQVPALDGPLPHQDRIQSGQAPRHRPGPARSAICSSARTKDGWLKQRFGDCYAADLHRHVPEAALGGQGRGPRAP